MSRFFLLVWLLLLLGACAGGQVAAGSAADPSPVHHSGPDPCSPATVSSVSSPEAAIDPFWVPLLKRLASDGEDEASLVRIFAREDVRFDPRVMPRKLAHKEDALPYERFLASERIARARRFQDDNILLLDAVERDFGVPKEIQVAILLVETDLGSYLGGAKAFTILASLARASSIDEMGQWLPAEFLVPPERDRVEKRLRDKSEWAYRELRSLIAYSAQNGLDPVETPASIFGAIGICQFMPSNAMRFGIDRDSDGRVDLFTLSDALASMANYLRSYGWALGISPEEQEGVILAYNHSRPYARTVLAVAERLGWKDGKHASAGRRSAN